MKYKYRQLLSPYGDFPHTKGTQRVSRFFCQKMIKKFHRFFAKKVPIYVGHPDQRYSRWACKKFIIGYVVDIGFCEEGIYVDCEYSTKGIVELETYKFMSARWRTYEEWTGLYIPIELISIGLTNEPNIEGSGKVLEREYVCRNMSL